MDGSSVRDLLSEGRQQLGGGTGARREAEILLGHALGVGRAWLFANPERVVDTQQSNRYRELLARRQQGEPVAYLTGIREFWSLPLTVTPAVLVPRPETELLVDVALAFIPQDAAWRVADLGTGSGAIALAIASERPACEVHATEISEEALQVALENGRRLLPGAVAFHHGSWLEPLKGTFSLIVSNPPYVPRQDPHLGRGDCRFEPEIALTPGEDGLSTIREIAGRARDYLEPGGMLAFEHGFDQASGVRDLLAREGLINIATRKDLEKRDRVTYGFRP
jgi:release factor glutamine methyltransferase